jgi:hypothetical protein
MMHDSVKFFRRRQFALGPQYFEFGGWNRLQLETGYFLTVHPELQVTIAEYGANRAALLGYAIDPYQPDLDDRGILERFAVPAISLDVVLSVLEGLSGRFVLIIKNSKNLWLFHDAVALRQVHYCRDEHNVIWCASQAETLAEYLKFDYDAEVLSYRDLPCYRSSLDEFWLLNDRTPYREIRCLLPNHYLDLHAGRAHRYWPVPGCIKALSVDESIQLSSLILQNSIRAAALRFDLRMGISAGGDSRKTLAASKEERDRIYFFTHTPTQASMVVNDMKVPATLLPKLGLVHHGIPLGGMDNEFRRYYEQSATWARVTRGHIACTLLDHFGPETTVLNSNISEVAQRIYWLPRSKITGKGLAVLNGLNHPFAVREFEKWLEDAIPACEAAKMNVLDLFFLEQRMGRWAAAAFAEYDIAHETFNPYNNRRLHCLMLGVSERRRRNRRWEVLIKQIKSLWPEVLVEPINPPDGNRDKMQQFIRRYLLHKAITPWLPLYEYLRYLKLRWNFTQTEAERMKIERKRLP